MSIHVTIAALADPTRFAIVESLLKKGAQTAGEIAEPFGISKPAISRHLRVLEDAGVIERRVERQYRVFRAKPEGFRELEEWFERYRRFWRGSFDRLEKMFDDRRTD